MIYCKNCRYYGVRPDWYYGCNKVIGYKNTPRYRKKVVGDMLELNGSNSCAFYEQRKYNPCGLISFLKDFFSGVAVK